LVGTGILRSVDVDNCAERSLSRAGDASAEPPQSGRGRLAVPTATVPDEPP